MSKRFIILAGVVLAVALMGAAMVVPMFADEPAPTPTAKPRLGCRGLRFGFWGGSWAVFDAAAEALGLSPEQLFAELHSGKSIADVAEEKDVELQQVCDATKAAQVDARKQAIESAVENGRLTREQADWLLKGLELGFGPGRGFGRGGRGGFGFKGNRPSRGLAPSSAPSMGLSSS